MASAGWTVPQTALQPDIHPLCYLEERRAEDTSPDPFMIRWQRAGYQAVLAGHCRLWTRMAGRRGQWWADCRDRRSRQCVCRFRTILANGNLSAVSGLSWLDAETGSSVTAVCGLSWLCIETKSNVSEAIELPWPYTVVDSSTTTVSGLPWLYIEVDGGVTTVCVMSWSDADVDNSVTAVSDLSWPYTEVDGGVNAVCGLTWPNIASHTVYTAVIA